MQRFLEFVKKHREKINAILLLAILLIFINWILPTVNTPEAKEFIKKLGPAGPLVVILYLVLSHILAPMTGSPILVLSIVLFGIWNTVFIAYIGHIISASVCFYISRVYGKRIVRKLAGETSMKEIEVFSNIDSSKILIVSRILGMPVFEFVSYAMGFTKISYKKYIQITSIAMIPSYLFFLLVFNKIDFTNKITFFSWLVLLFLVGAIFSIVLTRYVKKHNKKID